MNSTKNWVNTGKISLDEMEAKPQANGKVKQIIIEMHDYFELEKCPECGGQLKVIDPTTMGFSPFREQFTLRCLGCNLYISTLSNDDLRPRKTELWEYDKMRDEEFQARREEERGGFYE